jgi:hypothetical protein
VPEIALAVKGVAGGHAKIELEQSHGDGENMIA